LLVSAPESTPDVDAAIGELADRFGLSDRATDQLRTLLELVAGDPDAPTTVTDPMGVLRDHLADSLVALELAELRGAAEIADLGSGAGFPGLPLAIALPSSQVQLVESNARKCEFIARAITAIGLRNATVAHARAEEWSPAPPRRVDVVTARALAPLPVVAEYAAPLLRIGGHLIAWRGRRDAEAEAAAARACEELGLEIRAPLRVKPYPEAENRHLHVMSKVKVTPARFPRRPGAATKRPLGGV
jgi:16S rRNA (guanine527-N7)-methyltransferase